MKRVAVLAMMKLWIEAFGCVSKAFVCFERCIVLVRIKKSKRERKEERNRKKERVHRLMT